MRFAMVLLAALFSGGLGAQAAGYPAADSDGFVWLLWGTDYSRGYRADYLERIARSGARHVTVPFLGCQSDLASHDVGDCSAGKRRFDEESVRMAKARGFDVAVIPILVTREWEWRGFIEPRDRDAWFRNYGAWIEGIARFSAGVGATEMIAATEMNRLYRHEDRWRELVGRVRRIFDGPVLLTVNWDDLDHDFFDVTDAVSVSGYFPLSASSDPTQEELDAAWREIRERLAATAAKWDKPLHITELGYQSVAGTASTPWAAPADAPEDPALQARCFRAFARAWTGSGELIRVNVWATGDLHRDHYPRSFEPLGKPAEAVLGRFFERRRGLLQSPLR